MPGLILPGSPDAEYLPVRNPIGEMEIHDVETDRKVVAGILRCCHCGKMFVPMKGQRQGFCMAHFRRTCGSKDCGKCPLGK
jgi:hypothetical protein